jgi:hypothetical protein
MVALALIFTVAMELDMANHQAGQGQGSKGEPLAFLCAQLQPPGMPRRSPGACTAHCWRSACCLSIGQSSGSWGECSKDPFGSRCTPHYYHSKKLSTTTPFGVLQISSEFPTHSLNLINYLPTAYTSSFLTTTFTVSQMVLSSFNTFTHCSIACS